MSEAKKWNVTFLIDNNPPEKVALLKRSPEKKFAPNFYTGIGGKIGDLPEFEMETLLESAYRELSEETEGELSKENLELTEFARCVYEDGSTLYYFWGMYNEDTTPHIDPNDGTLVWIPKEDLLDKDIIPTTKVVCREWENRAYSLDSPFTVYVREIGEENTVKLVKAIKLENGLL